MNHVTAAERAELLTTIAPMVELDAEGRIIEFYDLAARAAAQYGVSISRARAAIAKAARQQRYAIIQARIAADPVASAAQALGSRRTERKATAARENGKRGGRPRKQPCTHPHAYN